LLALSCGRSSEHHTEQEQSTVVAAAVASVASSAEHPQSALAETRDPPQLRSLQLVDGKGDTVQVSCITCHSLAPLDTLRAQNLSVHGKRTLSHGSLGCQSCHDKDHNDKLVLAGGDTINMTEALTLCAQCHGPQFRDYKRGSHGGMKGYWDRSVGTRERKHCVECHEPHSPAFRPMMPVLPPSTAGHERH
jgi:hypothetical protein